MPSGFKLHPNRSTGSWNSTASSEWRWFRRHGYWESAYIEYVKVKSDYHLLDSAYSCLSCGNLYALVIERCFKLGRNGSRLGMIVQLSAICTDRMEQLQSAQTER